jgi:hypothetical protein
MILSNHERNTLKKNACIPKFYIFYGESRGIVHKENLLRAFCARFATGRKGCAAVAARTGGSDGGILIGQ